MILTILAGIVLSGILNAPWPLVAALIIAAIMWYGKKYGSPYAKLKAWRQRTRAAPAPGATPAKKRWTSWLPIKTLSGLFKVIAIVIALASLFQPTRDIMLDLVRRPEVSTAITGMETTRSVQVSSLTDFKICDLKPDTTYTFVKAETSARDDVSYEIRNREDGSMQVVRITGMLSSAPEKLPYPDGKYDFGILLGGIPPGRRTETNGEGCLRASFNTNLGQFYGVIPFGMSFYLKTY